jgi:hypothetical protein
VFHLTAQKTNSSVCEGCLIHAFCRDTTQAAIGFASNEQIPMLQA